MLRFTYVGCCKGFRVLGFVVSWRGSQGVIYGFATVSVGRARFRLMDLKSGVKDVKRRKERMHRLEEHAEGPRAGKRLQNMEDVRVFKSSNLQGFEA